MPPIEVEHRKDELLQNSARKQLPEHLKDTFVGQHTKPTHIALLAFLDEEIIGKPFETEAELQTALGTWPEYALEKHDLALHKDFSAIDISKEGHIFCGESLGGEFVIGNINQI